MQVLLDLNMKSCANILILVIRRRFGCILCVQMCCLLDRLEMRENLNGDDGWSGWDLLLIPFESPPPPFSQGKLVSLDPPVDERACREACSWRSVAKKLPSAEIPLITAQDPSEKQWQWWELFLGEEKMTAAGEKQARAGLTTAHGRN